MGEITSSSTKSALQKPKSELQPHIAAQQDSLSESAFYDNK